MQNVCTDDTHTGIKNRLGLNRGGSRDFPIGLSPCTSSFMYSFLGKHTLLSHFPVRFRKTVREPAELVLDLLKLPVNLPI